METVHERVLLDVLVALTYECGVASIEGMVVGERDQRATEISHALPDIGVDLVTVDRRHLRIE